MAKRKCPICNSQRFDTFGGEMRCHKCGYRHSDKHANKIIWESLKKEQS